MAQLTYEIIFCKVLLTREMLFIVIATNINRLFFRWKMKKKEVLLKDMRHTHLIVFFVFNITAYNGEYWYWIKYTNKDCYDIPLVLFDH